jgi:hypothetical protein
MNSLAGKRYLSAQPERIVKGDWKVFDLSNGNVIFAADKPWAETVAHGYNQYYCLPNKQFKYFVMNFAAVFDSINKNNGASYNLHTRTLNPDSGYMVSLSGFESIVDVPQDLNKFQDTVVAYCIDRKLWDKIASDPINIYLGFWVNDGKLYIDLSENINDFGTAYHLAVERGQIAFYDCTKKQEVKVLREYISPNLFTMVDNSITVNQTF